MDRKGQQGSGGSQGRCLEGNSHGFQAFWVRSGSVCGRKGSNLSAKAPGRGRRPSVLGTCSTARLHLGGLHPSPERQVTASHQPLKPPAVWAQLGFKEGGVARGRAVRSSPVNCVTLVGGGVTDTLCASVSSSVNRIIAHPSSEANASPELGSGREVVRAVATVKQLGFSGPGAWASVHRL